MSNHNSEVGYSRLFARFATLRLKREQKANQQCVNRNELPSGTAVQISRYIEASSRVLLVFLDGFFHFRNEVGYPAAHVVSKMSVNLRAERASQSVGRTSQLKFNPPTNTET